MKEKADRFAILIDADNISSNYIKTIVEETAIRGEATIRRIYGNWTAPTMASWREVLLEYSLTPMQQFNNTTGKNSTDCAMIIDAMDILYSGNVDGFVLVSSDSDFTRLAARLRESGMIVIGMCEHKTPNPFLKSCTEVKYLDKIEQTTASTEKTENKSVKKTKKKDPKSEYIETIDQVLDEKSTADGWVPLSLVGIVVKNQYSDFDPKNHGYKKMTDFIKSLGYETKEEPDVNNKQSSNGVIVYIRKKTKKK